MKLWGNSLIKIFETCTTHTRAQQKSSNMVSCSRGTLKGCMQSRAGNASLRQPSFATICNWVTCIMSMGWGRHRTLAQENRIVCWWDIIHECLKKWDTYHGSLSPICHKRTCPRSWNTACSGRHRFGLVLSLLSCFRYQALFVKKSKSMLRK